MSATPTYFKNITEKPLPKLNTPMFGGTKCGTVAPNEIICVTEIGINSLKLTDESYVFYHDGLYEHVENLPCLICESNISNKSAYQCGFCEHFVCKECSDMNILECKKFKKCNKYLCVSCFDAGERYCDESCRKIK